MILEGARAYKKQAPEDPREAYLPLVIEQAERALARLPEGAVDREELISLGAIGLLEGLDRFDPARGVPIEAYLRTAIRHRILDGLRQQDRIPKGLRQKERMVREAVGAIEQETLLPATDDQVAQRLRISVPQLRSWLADLAYTTVWSLEAIEAESGFEIEEPGEGPEGEAWRREVERILKEAITRLPKREREVLWLHYYRGYSLHEVALALGLSDAYMSQIHSRAIMRLRGALGDMRTVLVGGGDL